MRKQTSMVRHARVIGICCLVATAACASLGGRSQRENTVTAPNALSRAEVKAGWRLLFDGSTTKGWRGYKSPTVAEGWKVDSGVLYKEAGTRDLVSEEQFGDFELLLEWKIGRAGNSGIFYRGSEEYNRIYWSAPEYQLLDDVNASDNKIDTHLAASNYALHAPVPGVVRPYNEWNTTRIVAHGAQVEHWLNGQKVVEYDIGSPDWEARVKASKFAAWANYGRAKKGHIAIQGDHRGRLELRNVKIREIR